MLSHIRFRKLWLAVVFVGLLLIMAVHAQSYDCITCHGSPHGPGLKFHSADRLICSKCHTMHYSEDGTTPPDADEDGPFDHLLVKAHPTDVCLICHQGDTINTTGAPIVMTLSGVMGTGVPSLPGGDFFYSKTDPSNGHNPGGVIGTDTVTPSPGGGFVSEDESCISCHDPHGGSPVNDYRLLKKIPEGWTGGELLVVGDESHPGGDEGPVGNAKPGYESGFSAWCAACHGGFHGDAMNDSDVGDITATHWIRHPTDRGLGTEIAGNYGTDYDWQYPVQNLAPKGMVGAEDQVFCLSCHRSHGTPYFSSTRGDNSQPSGPGTGCNKCHAKGS